MYGIPYSEYTAEKKDTMIKINLEAPVCLIEQAFGLNNNIKVVNLASIAGQIGHPDIWYGVTKAGIINLTKSLAKAMGPQGAVINCIAPGPVKTDMLDTIPQARKDALKSATIS
jgi:3-oxoacyl-[acyl-carrier protein] reductase